MDQVELALALIGFSVFKEIVLFDMEPSKRPTVIRFQRTLILNFYFFNLLPLFRKKKSETMNALVMNLLAHMFIHVCAYSYTYIYKCYIYFI